MTGMSMVSSSYSMLASSSFVISIRAERRVKGVEVEQSLRSLSSYFAERLASCFRCRFINLPLGSSSQLRIGPHVQ